MSTHLTRRSVAKGAAWSVPAMTVAAAAPAVAASGKAMVAGTICSIEHGYSGNINYESSYRVNLGFTSSTGTIPAGTVITYSFTLAQGAARFADSEVPTVPTIPSGAYSIAVSPSAGTKATAFTVTVTVNKDLDAASNSCGPYIVWNTDQTLRGGTEIGFAGTSVTGDKASNSATSNGLVWRAGQRYGNSGTPQKATHFISQSGEQCYPAIQYTYGDHSSSSWTTCGDGNTANDTSTIYPDNSCVKLALTTGSSASVPEKCVR